MNSVLFDFGFFQLQWYSVLIFVALLVGGAVALLESRRFEISEDFMINLYFYMIPIALIGARLYYVIFNWSYYSSNKMEIFQVWQGGLAIHGAIIFGLIWIIFYCKKYKVNTMRILDVIAPGLIIGQAIGRWGNFFNQEAYGSVTSLQFLRSLHLPTFIINGMNINGMYYHPTFFYESMWALVGFIIILVVRRFKYIKVGQITGFYLLWYGFGRFFIEWLRTDSLMLGNIKMAQIISLIMFIVGLIMIIPKRHGSIFDNQYNNVEEAKSDIKF